MKNSKQLATLSILITLCLIFSYIEFLIPFNFALPGVKLGLSNIVVLFALYKLGTKSAFFINIMRIFITAMLFTNPITMLYSISGGLLSFLAMFIVKKIKILSIISVSISGSIFHNIGQILMASIVLSSQKIILYLPILMVFGIITGGIIGLTTAITLERLRKI